LGSVENIRSATVEELAAVKGITRPVAVAIKEML
jgi:excinuclease UvrABC nuclease subunit